MARDDLPTEFAVFPLPGALLLPGGKLPLNIFERRYLAMVDDALASGRVIGMIQPDELRAGTPTGPALTASAASAGSRRSASPMTAATS